MNPEAKRKLSSIFSVKLLTISEDNLSIVKMTGEKRFSAVKRKQRFIFLQIKYKKL